MGDVKLAGVLGLFLGARGRARDAHRAARRRRSSARRSSPARASPAGARRRSRSARSSPSAASSRCFVGDGPHRRVPRAPSSGGECRVGTEPRPAAPRVRHDAQVRAPTDRCEDGSLQTRATADLLSTTMASRTKTIVGLDIEPGIHRRRPGGRQRPPRRRACRRRRRSSPARRPRRRGRRRRGLAEALRDAVVARTRLDKRVRIGVANQRIVVRVMDLPPLEDAKELEAAVRFQAQDELPMPLDAGGPRLPVARPRRDARPARASASCSSRPAATWSSACSARARAAGLRPEGIDLSAFAMVRALHAPGRTTARSSTSSVGGLTNLAVADGRATASSPASRRRPRGAWRRARRAPGPDARARPRAGSRHVGLETPVDDDRRRAAIVADARAGADRRRAPHRRRGPQLPGLPPHPERRSPDGRARRADRPRRRGARLRRRRSSASSASRSSRASSPGAPDGIDAGRAPHRRRRPGGRGGRGMRAVNLIPADQRALRPTPPARAAAPSTSCSALSAIVVAMVAALTLTKHSIAENTAKADALDAQAQIATAKVGNLAAYKQFNEVVKTRAAGVKTLAATRFDWGETFEQVSRVVPSDVSLTQLVASTAPGPGRWQRQPARRAEQPCDRDRRLRAEPVARRAAHGPPAPPRGRAARERRVLQQAGRRRRRHPSPTAATAAPAAARSTTRSRSSRWSSSSGRRRPRRLRPPRPGSRAPSQTLNEGTAGTTATPAPSTPGS